MTLHARVGVELGSFELDVGLDSSPGETLVVVGPNGAGKTTLLRAVAGLAPIDAGRIVLDGIVLDDPSARTWVSPDRRSVGFVFQDLLLFPHLSALDNIGFGLRARGTSRNEARRLALGWLARVGLDERATARPSALSGGEAQRVALARALAPEPAVLLLDEPLAALDAFRRTELRRDLRRLLAGYSGICIVVTHDPIDAIALGDRLVVLEAGRVTQDGTPTEVCERPRSRYVAEFVGLNLYRGRAEAGRLELGSGAALVAADATITGEAFAVVHPRAVALHQREPEGTPRNVWSGTVAHVDPEGDRARVRVDAPVPITAEITAGAVHDLAVREGSRVWVSVKATEIALYAA
jgi:molybdate transport system ATP-binding protein